MPRIIIHCGLHKTGTTALQQFLMVAAPSLLQLGILYPRAGRLDHFGGGHHNIAWHLTRDRRYDAALGSFASLLDELAAFDGDAVLSSEDFETCLGDPRLFAPLTQESRLRGRQFVFVVYLREQISYAEGLFTENLGHGMGEDCRAVVGEILDRRALAAWEWRFQFDYLQILRRMRALAPAQIVFRGYASLVGDSVVPDFISVVSPGTVLNASGLPRTNPRWKLLDGLTMFLQNRIRRKLNEAEAAALRLMVAEAGGPPLALATGIRRALAKTFGAGNQTLCREAGLAPDTLDLDARVALPPGEHCFIDRVFSFETQVAVAALAALLPEDGLRPLLDTAALPPAARALLGGVATDWRRDRGEV